MTKRPNPPAAPPSPAHWQPGFTLIELMIAITIGLVMMVALLALFANSSRSNNEIAKMNGLIENGRFAIQLLQSDLAVAGFWGTYLPQFSDLSPTSTPPMTYPRQPPSPARVRPMIGTMSPPQSTNATSSASRSRLTTTKRPRRFAPVS